MKAASLLVAGLAVRNLANCTGECRFQMLYDDVAHGFGVQCTKPKATGYAGPAAAPLVEKLTALLKDSDESLRITLVNSARARGTSPARS